MKIPEYVSTGGQTSRPFGQINIPYVKWEKMPTPMEAGFGELPPLDLIPELKEKGWCIQCEGMHFLPNVTSEMIDWFWCNMEKGYYLWAPGSHKRFQWIKEPWEVGFTNSVHTCVENMHEGTLVDMEVAAGTGYGMLLYHRYDMDVYPYDYAMKHVIIEGTEDENGHCWMLNIHMWEDVDGGVLHRTVAATETFEQGALILPPDEFPCPRGKYNVIDHCEYEITQWSEFLPGLYNVWKNHPDPTQNVMYDLSVEQTGPYTWKYVDDNSASVLKRMGLE